MKNKKKLYLFFLISILSIILFLAGRSLSILQMGRRPLFIIFVIMAICGLWLVRHLSKIKKGIDNISQRTYTRLPEKGIFSEVYGALNKMDMEIRQSDKIKEETENTRTEWIANITHDLKTPLSPVKGYAELLADNQIAGVETAQEYGKIILKNVSHVEKLLNDLKLTYQIDSGVVPYNPQEILITRYVKEVVIDIINDPAFSKRIIEFESDGQELIVFLDPDLLRRAIQNIIINALIHNPPDTKIKISIGKSAARVVFISICDNGSGMDEAEQAKLFNRYYRGTNTREKPEGTGKQRRSPYQKASRSYR